MTERNKTMPAARRPVGASGASPGPERKRRRLAATIAKLETHRPRLPLQADTAAVFDTAAWLARWRAIRPTCGMTAVYVAGCLGATALGRRLGAPTFKPGTAADVAARIAKLNSERHGSVAIRDFTIVDEPGWDTWEASRLSARPTHPASPVRVLPRHLAVEIPGWITPQDFEASVVAALEPVSLAHLAARPAGRTLTTRRGCIDEMLRYTRKAHGPVLATEISVLAPSGDAAALVALVEWIIIRAVLADEGEH